MSHDDREMFLIARIGPNERLFPLAHVREVVPAMELAQTGGLSGACCGMANVRGEVVPVFDPLVRGRKLSASQLIVITENTMGAGNTCLGLLVDDVVEIVELPSSAVAHHPAGNGRTVRAANLAGRTLSVLTLEEVLGAA